MRKLIRLRKHRMKIIFLCLLAVPSIYGHGRLMDPPNRSSIWRFQEFSHLNPPENYNDNELFCGGRTVQHDKNEGKCGECGDPYNDTRPRANEGGGTFAKGIIVRNYTTGQTIDVDVELTSSHKGYFEFRLCPWNQVNVPEEQTCFDRYLLPLADGSGTRMIVPTFQAGHYKTKVVLPSGVKCSQCVFQWTYITGNTWGSCGNGTSAIGCGPQENFRGCADVGIY
ncbi:unnamed protein product [Allacma fusca]|uniref:Chitin-binding type-4 domain-containing protein n=1 Tax=Allacma fusca TaxID=39272 RepID=A0A8J2JEV6_9HEXA|nr:unnamed protein product [Allacma fusca]